MANINATLVNVKCPCLLTDPEFSALHQVTEVLLSSVIYVASTITGSVAYGSVCIYLYFTTLPALHILFTEERKEIGYLAKTGFQRTKEMQAL